MKKISALLLALLLVFMSTVCLAATPVNSQSAAKSGLSAVTPFKFEHKKKGIGKGLCPVYSAPYRGAYRAANGKAAVNTNYKLDIGGFSSNGWLLVRYSTNNGGCRVGWVPPKYVKGVKSSMYPHFSRVKQTASKAMYVTDNNLDPYDRNGWFARLEKGETYYVVGRYNYYEYDMWYIEFDIGNQVARGFILR